jgi:Ribbon-helix-helix protein, copG family.
MSKYEAITVRLEPEDKAEIERAAKALQQSVSAFARDVIREDLNRRKLLAKAEGEQKLREVAA